MAKLNEAQWEQIQSELYFRFIRSSGPGGQKVNKTSSKAELRWPLISTEALSERQFEQVVAKLEGQTTSEGDIVIQADTMRSRLQNRSEALGRLRDLIDGALFKAKPRKKTRPKKSAIRKRLSEKKQHGDKKRNRQKVDY